MVVFILRLLCFRSYKIRNNPRGYYYQDFFSPAFYKFSFIVVFTAVHDDCLMLFSLSSLGEKARRITQPHGSFFALYSYCAQCLY